MFWAFFPKDRIEYPTNRIHHIPVDPIIVSIKTNTIPIKTIKSITISIVSWAGFYIFFSAGYTLLAEPVFTSDKKINRYGLISCTWNLVLTLSQLQIIFYYCDIIFHLVLAKCDSYDFKARFPRQDLD